MQRTIVRILIACGLLTAVSAGLAPAAGAAGGNRELQRVLGLMSDTRTGGSGGERGVLVREVGKPKPVLASGESRQFEPASSMKVVLAVATELGVQNSVGTESYRQTVDAWRYPSNPGGRAAGDKDLCPVVEDEVPGNRETPTLQAAQTAMLQLSDNRMTRAILKRLGGYGGEVADVIAMARMTATTLEQDFPGCAHRDGKANLTTLTDLSRLYAAIDRGRILSPARRRHLYVTMNLGGRRTWSAESPFGQMVTQEAARIRGLPADAVPRLMATATASFKGGSYLIITDGRATVHLSSAGLQRVRFGPGDVRTFTVGTYTDGRECPLEAAEACYDAVGRAVANVGAPGNAYIESMRSVVRRALLSARRVARR